jgi:hypothetical protein
MGTDAATLDRLPPARPNKLWGGYLVPGAQWVLRVGACGSLEKIAGGGSAAWRLDRLGDRRGGLSRGATPAALHSVPDQGLSGLDLHPVAWSPSHGLSQSLDIMALYCAIRLTAGFARWVAAPIGRAGGALHQPPAVAGGVSPFCSRARVTGGSRPRRPEFGGFAGRGKARNGPAAHYCHPARCGNVASSNGVGGAGGDQAREISPKRAGIRAFAKAWGLLEAGWGALGLRFGSVNGQGSQGAQAMAGGIACQPT